MSSNNTEDHSGSGDMTSNKKECISCDQNNVNTITEGINKVDILSDMSTCASCGKEGNSNDMNTCNKCKSVKYCNAACKKKHRHKHKKACERRVAELYDEQLFKEVEPEECPICMLTMPHETNTSVFMPCCGKSICCGCIYAMKMSEGKDLCPFCRMPPASSDEYVVHINSLKNLMDKGNGDAFNHLAGCYADGMMGLIQDYGKANKLYLKAGELGCAQAYYNLGNQYCFGRGAEIDQKKAKHYYELAAIGGNVDARHNLGCLEGAASHDQRAYKHMIIAARAGYKSSLDRVKLGFMEGLIAKDEYANTLRAYQKRRKEMKSDERDKAAVSGIFSH